MIHEKIRSASNALGALAHRVDEEAWAVIRLVRANLEDAANQAQELEESPLVSIINTKACKGVGCGQEKTKANSAC